jgi:hypothetical protein
LSAPILRDSWNAGDRSQFYGRSKIAKTPSVGSKKKNQTLRKNLATGRVAQHLFVHSWNVERLIETNPQDSKFIPALP